MFLRGYGSQSFSQDNGEMTSKNTVHKSGEVGKIQGDAHRKEWWAAGTIPFFDDYLGTFNQLGGLRGSGNRGDEWTDHDFNLPYGYIQFYEPYLETTQSPCGVGSIELKFEKNLYIDGILGSEEPYDSVGTVAIRHLVYQNKLIVPTANEVRPVNVAVRYYIKAK